MKIKDSIMEILENHGYSNLEPDMTLNLDSLAIIEIIVDIENQFNFEFDIDELDFSNFKTINNICSLVESKVKNL